MQPIGHPQRPYSPFQPSHLASSSSSPSSSNRIPSSDLPSSPTTSSFLIPSRPPRIRVHKGRQSIRSSSATTTSPGGGQLSLSTSARLAALSAAHVSRSRSIARARGSTGVTDADEPGGWTAEGEWEEFDAAEQARLEVEMMKARREYRWECRRREEEADEMGVLFEEEEREEELEYEEPPLDLLYDDFDPIPSPSLFPPRLPSLASAAGSPGSSSAAMSIAEDSDMGDGGGGESQESTTSSYLNPSSDLPLDENTFSARLAEFDSSILGASCPACGAVNGVVANEQGGASCAMGLGGEGGADTGEVSARPLCHWEIPRDVMEPLRRTFAGHGPRHPKTPPHLPLLHYSPFTGTLVLCGASGCDEELAA